MAEQKKVSKKAALDMVKDKKEIIVRSEVLIEPMEYGRIFAASEMFPDVKSAAQGAVKLMAGRELGMTPIQSLNSFYFVAGRIAIMAQAMGACIKKSGKYDYEIIEHTEEICRIAFYKTGIEKEKIGESEFTKKMAAAAGIINKDNWRNYPKNMLFCRALANGARWFCPDAIAGFYSVEELQDLTSEKKEEIVEIKGNEVIKQNGEKRLSE